jgi:hypothetical protein
MQNAYKNMWRFDNASKNVEIVEECPQKCEEWNMLKQTCK